MFYTVPDKALRLLLDKLELEMKPKKFKSGSVGWFLGGKEMIDGVRVQLSFSAVIVGSKPPADLIEIEKEEDLRTLMDKHANLPIAVDPRPKKGNKPPKGKKLS